MGTGAFMTFLSLSLSHPVPLQNHNENEEAGDKAINQLTLKGALAGHYTWCDVLEFNDASSRIEAHSSIFCSKFFCSKS